MQELNIDERKTLNRLAREQMKLKILKDISMDMQICKLEGWNITEFIDELIRELERLRNDKNN